MAEAYFGGVYAEGMADSVLAGVMHFVRGLDVAVRQQVEGKWLSALGCNCYGVRRRSELGIPAGFEMVVGFDEMESILPSEDIAVIAAPLTPATRKLMYAKRLALLPDGAIVVNVARGALRKLAFVERRTSVTQYR